MTNQEILKIAMAQSAIDLCAAPDDFEKSENVVVTSHENDGARRYLKLPFSCQLVSYGNNVVASVSPEFRQITENYVNKYPVEHLFETPHLHVLNEALMAKGQKICFMAEYFLPDVDILRERVVEDAGQRTVEDACPYEMRILTQADFADLYLPEWSNALCKDISSLTCWAWGRMTATSWLGLQAAVPTVIPCGRSALTCFPSIAGRELPLR